MEAQIEGLRVAVEHGFRAINTRLDDFSDVQDHRYNDNVNRLKEITIEVRATNGRVTRHDEQIITLFRHIKGMFSGEPKPESGFDFEKQTVTFGWLWKLGALVGVVVGVTYGILRLMGFHQ